MKIFVFLGYSLQRMALFNEISQETYKGTMTYNDIHHDIYIIITINPKFDLPKMSTAEVIGIQKSSRFPAILGSYPSIYMLNSRVAPLHNIWSEATP